MRKRKVERRGAKKANEKVCFSIAHRAEQKDK